MKKKTHKYDSNKKLDKNSYRYNKSSHMYEDNKMAENTAATAEAIPMYGTDILNGSSKTIKILLVVLFVSVLLAGGLFCGVRFYYSNHWYPNTTVSGIDVSGMKFDESKELLSDTYEDYRLLIQGRDGGNLVIHHDDIDYKSHHEAALETAFETQHKDFKVFSLFGQNPVTIDAKGSYDDDKLKQYLFSSELVCGSDDYEIVKPKDAYVDFLEDKSCIDIVEELKGNKLKKQKLLDAVKEVLNNGDTKMDLTDEEKYDDLYFKPKVTSDDYELESEKDLWNSAILRWITWKIDDENKVTVSPDLIYEWCYIKNGKVKFRKQAIRDWMEEFCLKYKTVGVTRTFKNHAGKKIDVTGGDYGWSFDYEQMVSQLMKSLKKDMDVNSQEEYINEPTNKNKKALTIKKEPIYSGTAHRMDLEDKSNDWDKKNFVEVSLKDQMVYVWRNGKIKFKCECISGRPVPGRQTQTGAFFIKEHKPAKVLKGEDYSTPVTYWVRITWSGTGFHEAHWQRWGSWSKTYYLSGGSHGCINLSPENAKKIYELTKYKELVYIY